MPARLVGPTRQLFERIGPELPFARRFALANLWLSRPLLVDLLERSPVTNALVRTTAAATVFEAGTKDNVLPTHGRAVINVRILPGDSIAGVVEHVRRVIDDSRVEVKTAGAFSAEPSAVSSSDSEGFRGLTQAIRSLHPDAIVAPFLVVVATDARHYAALSRDVYRFLPLRLTPQDLDRMHGIDERVAVDHYEDAVRTYRQLILTLAGR
jgi:carboxypeptidase PM20D1